MHGIDVIGRLRQIDLNLLVSLGALLEERSVTRAGERLGLTQSAMSHCLKRLRDVFHDPLLVRGSGEMILTPRAEALVGRLGGLLGAIEETLEEPEGFDPASSHRTFGLASPDLFDALVLPELLARIARSAPFVSLVVAPRYADLSARLENGELDVAIQPSILDPEAKMGRELALDPELRQRRLFVDRFSAFVRPGHPVLARKKRLSPKSFSQLDHLLVSPTGRGRGIVDLRLAEHGLERNIRLRLPQFGAATAIVLETDLVLTAPASLIRRSPELREIKLPFSLPQHAINALWHPRVDADPGHRWLRERLVDSTRGIGVKAR